jgi:esterase/lipase superfamily enzyme
VVQKEIHSWWSPNTGREMELAIYGFYGYALLLFPTAASDHLEYERFNVIESIAPFINSGALKCFSINSINDEILLSKTDNPADKAQKHQQYNKYITDEVIPFIYKHCNGKVPVITAGASLGAFHAANSLFRRPDLFKGVIAMSGVYDIKLFTDSFYDENCYFNSPVDYLQNLTDENLLNLLRKKQIIIATGQGAYEDPGASSALSEVLHQKEIPHWLDMWGFDISHDWPTWKKMLPYYLENFNTE